MASGRVIVVDGKFCFEEETNLTVHKTSMFFPGDGFIVYDSNGEVIFRFDSYGPDSQPQDEVVLMDASGKCLLTLVRKVYGDAGEEYCIEGSYSLRRCKIYITSSEDPSKEQVAEIRRKVDPSTHVMLSKDVFWLCVQPGFDSAFAMGLVFILDQMYGDDGEVDAQQVDPAVEDSHF